MRVESRELRVERRRSRVESRQEKCRVYRVQSRESKGFRASMGALGACLGALGRVLGVLFGPLGSRGASSAALGVSSGALGWVLELPRGSFWSSRGLSGGSRKTKDEQEATIRHAKFYLTKFVSPNRRQYTTFPTFLRMRRKCAGWRAARRNVGAAGEEL